MFILISQLLLIWELSIVNFTSFEALFSDLHFLFSEAG
jgi:hypothetical protein